MKKGHVDTSYRGCDSSNDEANYNASNKRGDTHTWLWALYKKPLVNPKISHHHSGFATNYHLQGEAAANITTYFHEDNSFLRFSVVPLPAPEYGFTTDNGLYMNVNSLIDLHNPLFLLPIRLLDLYVRFTRRPFFIKYPTNMALSHAGRLWIFGILAGHTFLYVANGAPVIVSIILTLISVTSKHLL